MLMLDFCTANRVFGYGCRDSGSNRQVYHPPRTQSRRNHSSPLQFNSDITPQLNDRILNNDLLRHLAKMQMDSEASIRTNTCILIGRLGPSLGYNTKRKVLVPAFSRALKDPFVHARVAGLMAFMASVDVFDVEELAGKVVPNIAGSMVDKEKYVPPSSFGCDSSLNLFLFTVRLVRDQAFKAVELFVKKLESHAATMVCISFSSCSLWHFLNTFIFSLKPP